jgi:hypothetical protein
MDLEGHSVIALSSQPMSGHPIDSEEVLMQVWSDRANARLDSQK